MIIDIEEAKRFVNEAGADLLDGVAADLARFAEHVHDVYGMTDESGQAWNDGYAEGLHFAESYVRKLSASLLDDRCSMETMSGPEPGDNS